MAKNNPVAICSTKYKPSNDPKFHQIEMFEGEGMSTNALFPILKRGWVTRIGLFISLSTVMVLGEIQ
jgi:hypothetical protein